MAEAEQTGGVQMGGEGTSQVAKEPTETLAERLYPNEGAKDPATVEKKPGEAQTPVKSAETVAAPEPYNLRLPADTLIDQPLMNEFTAWARENKFTDEQAQKAAELHLKAIGPYAQEVGEYREQGEKRYTEVKGWGAEFQSDPQFGGAKAKATVSDALRCLDVFGTPAEVQRLRREFERTGIGDHPVLIRGLARVARLLGDKLPRSNGSKMLAQRMYPDQD